MDREPQQYLEWYYNNNVWKNMSWRGVRTLKLPSDMWNYQEIITAIDAQWVVETGTRHGGSAVFFSDLLRSRGARGRVITADIEHHELSPIAAAAPGIDFLLGDSGSEETAARISAIIGSGPGRGAVFMILDSDHSAAHVLRELRVLTPLLQPGDYLLVEDTIVNGHPVRPNHGPGPLEAIQQFLPEARLKLVPDPQRDTKFGPSFAAGGYFSVG